MYQDQMTRFILREHETQVSQLTTYCVKSHSFQERHLETYLRDKVSKPLLSAAQEEMLNLNLI